MAENNLAKREDWDLLKLFSHTSSLAVTRRRQQIMVELERRGFIYDKDRDDFLTCEQWNERHTDAKKDCNKEAE